MKKTYKVESDGADWEVSVNYDSGKMSVKKDGKTFGRGKFDRLTTKSKERWDVNGLPESVQNALDKEAKADADKLRNMTSNMNRNHIASELVRVAKEIVASQVAKTIAEQMGGIRRLKVMLGAEVIALSGGKGLGIRWPNKSRSKGNYVEITLKGDDTYTMEFFNVSTQSSKSVKTYRGVYFDQLVDIFEKQTGWYLRI